MCWLVFHICVHIYGTKYMIIFNTHMCVHICAYTYVCIAFSYMCWEQVYDYHTDPYMCTHIWEQVYDYCVPTYEYTYMGTDIWLFCLQTYAAHFKIHIWVQTYDHMSVHIYDTRIWSYVCRHMIIYVSGIWNPYVCVHISARGVFPCDAVDPETVLIEICENS